MMLYDFSMNRTQLVQRPGYDQMAELTFASRTSSHLFSSYSISGTVARTFPILSAIYSTAERKCNI